MLDVTAAIFRASRASRGDQRRAYFYLAKIIATGRCDRAESMAIMEAVGFYPEIYHAPLEPSESFLVSVMEKIAARVLIALHAS